MFYLINPKAIAREYLQPFVQKGAAYLDETQQGWTEKIAVDRLDISCGDQCICGQMFGAYDHRPNAVRDGWLFGFNLPSLDDIRAIESDQEFAYQLWEMFYNAVPSIWEVLDLCWLDEIWWRLPEPTKEKRAAWVAARRTEQLVRRHGYCSGCEEEADSCTCEGDDF